MKGDYFSSEQKKNTNILISLLKSVLKGLLSINSMIIQKNMTGGGYRLTMFFRRKDE